MELISEEEVVRGAWIDFGMSMLVVLAGVPLVLWLMG